MTTDPRELAREIAAAASARSGHRFIVRDSATAFGRSSYVMREGHQDYAHVTVRVSDHSSAARQRQVSVSTSAALAAYRAQQVERAIAALVQYADEPECR